MSNADQSHLWWQDCWNQLQKWTLLAESCGCKVWITVLLQGLWFSNCVAILALYFDIPVISRCMFKVWPLCHLILLRKQLALMILFLSIKTHAVLRVFTKLWIVCLLRNLSLQNLHQNILADPYFTQLSYRNTHCSDVYRTMTYHTAH
jgi:hypothetical protein